MLIRPFLTVGLAVAVALLTSNSEAAKPASPKKKAVAGKVHVHHGVVEKVSLKEKEGSLEHTGSITIKVHHHKKKTKKTESKEETFKIEKHTKVEREGKPAHLHELKKGEHVIIYAKDHVAEKIDIVHHKHKKKAKKTKKPTT
jgi:hypothetical protein